MNAKTCVAALVLTAIALFQSVAAAPGLTVTAGQTTFTDQETQQEMPVTILASPMPSGFYISRITCYFGNGLAPCTVRASECIQSGQSFRCTLTIAPVDYTANQAVYDPSSRSMTFTGNRMTVEYSSSEGSGKATLALPDVSIIVIPSCGNNGCERIAGESPSNCCVDCGCPYGQYCYTGGSASGQCVDTSQKQFYVSGFEPRQATAVPFYGGGKYLFPTGIEAKFKFSVGRPFSVQAAGFRLEGKDYRLNCTQPGASGEVSCPVELPPINPQEAAVSMDFFALISFKDSGVDQTQALQAQAKVPITVQRPPVENCMDKLNAIESKIGNLSDFVANYKELCKLWSDNKAKLDEAANKCCNSKDENDCICGKDGGGSVSQGPDPQTSGNSNQNYKGQDQSCYLCANPCICDSLPSFDALLNAYKAYKEHLAGVCSATDLSSMKSALSSMRKDISKAAESMNAVKKACEPVTKKWNGCQSWPSFPDCKRESGLVKHESTKLGISSVPSF